MRSIVNKTSRLLVKADDNRTVRFTIAAVLGALAWGIFLVVLGRSLHARPVPQQRLEQPLDMNFEIPDLAPTPFAATTRSSQMAAEPNKAFRLKQPSVQPARARVRPVRPLTPAPPLQPMTRAPQPARPAEPEAGSPVQTVTTGARPSSTEPGATSTDPAPAGSTPGNSPARAVTQPLPSVPDDLREQAYQTVAIARFVIHIDGSVAVELIKPTQYPRLNQILVQTLRSWRFFPAIQDGHPVETQQNIRVHFNVS